MQNEPLWIPFYFWNIKNETSDYLKEEVVKRPIFFKLSSNMAAILKYAIMDEVNILQFGSVSYDV